MMQTRRWNKIMAAMWFTQQHKNLFNVLPTVSDFARYLDMSRVGARKLLDAACDHGYMVKHQGEYNRFGTRTLHYDNSIMAYALYERVCRNRAMEIQRARFSDSVLT